MLPLMQPGQRTWAVGDLLCLLANTRPRDLLASLREGLTLTGMPRTPEPTMVMAEAEQVEAYTQAGSCGPGMEALYAMHTIQAVRRLHGCQRVVDLACGPANQLVSIARLLPDTRFLGIDLSERMLEKARALVARQGLGNVRFEHGDITRTPLPDHQTDGVMSTVSVHHLPTFELACACMDEIRRITAPGAACYLVDMIRPRSAANLDYLATRDHPGGSRPFFNDCRNSWRASFSAADWRTLADRLDLSGIEQRTTAPIRLFATIATPVRPLTPVCVQAIRRLQDGLTTSAGGDSPCRGDTGKQHRALSALRGAQRARKTTPGNRSAGLPG
ncbi:MAG: class I SAM-dependent methyltransferase, partial [Caulobacterales bacterium]|nr:class I SAM-dependent methyltransferase [Caulobacterales bacterium]